MMERLGLRLRFVLFFAAIYLGGLVAVIGGLWFGFSRSGGEVDGYVVSGMIASFVLLGVTAWVAFLFDENVAKPILALASDLKTRAQSEIGTEIDEQPARYLGALGPAANSINAALTDLRDQQQRAVAKETRRINRDKALFEALLRDLAEGVIVATPDHRVMLYNRAAQNLLDNLGLDRALASYLQAEPLYHALDRLAVRVAQDPASVESFLAATIDGEKFLLVRVGTVIADNTEVGYVITFNDATEDLAAHHEHNHLFNTLLEGTRRPVAAIAAVLDVLQTDAGIPPEMHATFNASMQEEVDRLIVRLQEIGTRHDAVVHRHWPMSRVSSSDIFAGLKARNIADLETEGEEQFLNCDAFAVLELLGRMIHELVASGMCQKFVLGAEPGDQEVRLTLGWSGAEVTDGQIGNWLGQPLSPVYGEFTGRDALTTHRTEIWSETTVAGPRLVLPLQAAAAPALRPTDERPEFYDFNLPAPSLGSEMDDRPLSELRFVVFDTETTGLSPRGGDEIVQIAGVRVVNGRILRGEMFDTLVDPKRPIPAASTAIHGIDDAMVQGAPDISKAGQAFHDFCEGSVLVAHNAPFDLAFLRLKQDQIGREFNHSVLCTVLLSAAIFEHTGQHTLDALTERFGVDLPADLRHTALGDAMATAEVFGQLLEVMKGAGITTMGQATAAARQMTHIRKAQNY
ncbi:MAG: exonuclease [Rhodobacteraceae bacterium]|nr:exonuclease [Paracoccaceae bacterium]